MAKDIIKQVEDSLKIWKIEADSLGIDEKLADTIGRLDRFFLD